MMGYVTIKNEEYIKLLEKALSNVDAENSRLKNENSRLKKMIRLFLNLN